MTQGHVWNQRIWELKESLEIISARGCDSRHFQEPVRYKFVIYKDGAVITEIWWTHRFNPLTEQNVSATTLRPLGFLFLCL